MIETQKIQAYKKAGLTEKINKLNRKAKKLNCPEITLTFGEETVTKYRDEYGRKRVNITVEATIEYEIPVIDGWKLISTFDIYAAKEKPKVSTTEVTGIGTENWINVVTTSTVPGETVPPEYQNKTEIHCDHCGHNRYRNHSMLMQHVETGEYKEVGSTCIKDFFGHDPVAFLRWASWSFEGIINELEDDDMGRGGYGPVAEDLRETLIFTSATIREYGWMSKGKAYERGEDWCTANEVARQMNPRTIFAKDEKPVSIDDRDREIADAAIEYFSNLTEADRASDYMNNCYKMTVLGYVPSKHHGLTVSMVPSYQRVVAERREADSDTSDFVGSIGDKLKDIKATCVFVKELSSDWGVKTLYIFKDENGNALKTFYTGDKWSAYEDDEVILSGKVKAHDTYKGKKSTMLNFVNVKVTKAPRGRETIEEVEALHQTPFYQTMTDRDATDNDELLNAFAA